MYDMETKMLLAGMQNCTIVGIENGIIPSL